ncbi:unnamed protein product [Cylindrotheca closterium]|uniref:DNA 3'-5' helicase n=1 Tax=Cylindrotheca closterium TaxID=2856 RepID=A0AAD2JN93_9STRA|nr:unnamed protein product [Cylindrotheca closterium]
MRSLASLNALRDAKRQESSALFSQKQVLMKEVTNIENRIQGLTNELMGLDDQIEKLEEQQHQQQFEEHTTLPQHQQETVKHEQPQSQPVTFSNSPVSPNENLTDPNTQMTQARNSQTQMSFDYDVDVDDDENDYGPAVTPHGGHNGRASIAASLPPLDLTHVPRNSNARRVSNVGAEQKPGLAAIVSPTCRFSELQIQQVLNGTFKIPTFRETQQDIIQATLSGQDCFVIMRTGGGKSLTYQLPAILEGPKITLVISPLLSLIQDQQEQMNAFRAQSCISFTSGMGQALHTQNWNRVRDPNGGVLMMIVTPEKVTASNKLKSELQKLHQQNRLGRIVIDECHCACQWGHDFRPDYAKLGILKHQFPSVPVLAVTATASDRVRNDCAQILRLSRHYRFFRSTANRPNLSYYVKPKDGSNEVLEDMAQFIKEKHPTSAGIIYAYSKKDADTVADELQERGIIAEAYHSEVSVTKKQAIHRSWMRNQTQVVVATIAFGLGINKPDVRFVLHHTLSKTLEAYYQESGRAGRDGKPADCILYYSPKDVPRLIKMINGERTETLFNGMIRYGQRFGNDTICRMTILESLGETGESDFSGTLKRYDTSGTHETISLEGSGVLKDITAHAKTLLQLLFLKQDDKLTMPMLLKEWRAKPDGAPECVQNNPPGKELSVPDCEQVIVQLLMDDYIKVDVKWSKYDSIIYLRCTRKAEDFLVSGNSRAFIRVPTRVARAKIPRASTGGSTAKRKKATTTKKRRASTGSTRRRSSSATGKRRKTTKAKSTGKGRGKKARTFPSSQIQTLDKFLSQPAAEPEVIELEDDSESEIEETFDEGPRRASLPARMRPRLSLAKNSNDLEEEDDLWASDEEEEYEFDG